MKKIFIRALSLLFTISVVFSCCSFSSAALFGSFFHNTVTDSEGGVYYTYNEKTIKTMNRIKDETLHICDSAIEENISITNKNIRKISFDNCSITSSAVSLPDTVETVVINNSEFSDYDFLADIDELDMLSIKNLPSIRNLKQFSSAKQITTIEVNNCTQLESLNGIENFRELDYVSITDCGIENIEPLKKLPKMDTLILTSTSVSNIEPIKNAPLKRIYLSNSVNIRNLDMLTGFSDLEELYAENLEMAYTQKLVDFVKKNHIKSNISQESLDIKNEVKAIAKKILKDDMTVQQKVEEIVYYVTHNVEYDYSIDFEETNDRIFSYNRDGLKNALSGKGVCRNYTSLTTALMYEAGFTAYEVENYAHIWNLIKIDGRFFWLDTTWIDCTDRDEMVKSPYYMSSSEDFLDSHYNAAVIPVSYKLSDTDFSKTVFETKASEKVNAVSDVKAKAEKTTNTDKITTKEYTTESISDTNEKIGNTTAADITAVSDKEVSTTEKTAEVTENNSGKTNTVVIVSAAAAAAAGLGAVIIIKSAGRKKAESEGI